MLRVAQPRPLYQKYEAFIAYASQCVAQVATNDHKQQSTQQSGHLTLTDSTKMLENYAIKSKEEEIMGYRIPPSTMISKGLKVITAGVQDCM